VGVFDFVKEAGAKIGIGESKSEVEARAAAEAAANEAEIHAASEAQAADLAERVRAAQAAQQEAQAARAAESLAEDKRSTELEQYVQSLGFSVESLDIRYDDGVANITGQVADQATREKVILAVGNSQGVQQVQESISVVAPEPESQMHVVVRGDTLSKIAKEYYGDANKYPTIFEANKPMLSNPDKIYPGQVLRIPPL
jgi:nucleoid-associated protein YgaU